MLTQMIKNEVKARKFVKQQLQQQILRLERVKSMIDEMPIKTVSKWSTKLSNFAQ